MAKDIPTAKKAGLDPQDGQADLVAAAYCNCDRRKLEQIGLCVLDYSLRNAVAGLQGCSVGVAVELGRVAGALVNPLNYHAGEAREISRRAAFRVASAFEEIARNIRARASD